jgi:NADH-quinone oxidoreductase subunit E
MSMFSFPTEMNMSEMMKPMKPMMDWTKTEGLDVSPLMVYPLGAAAAATAVGFGIAGQMAGMMMGAMQGAMHSQASLLGQHPDLSWMVPTLAEDLAPEEVESAPVDEVKPAVAAKSADIVELKPAPKPAPVKTKAKAAPVKTAKTNVAAAKTASKKAATPAKAKTAAAVEKLKSEAEVAAAATSESVTATEKPAEATSVLAPDDFRRPAEMEKPETPDDLKLISGVGPKLEQVLNGLGVWTFAQIAGWQPEEAAWVDDYLQFGGRVERDSWISQAGTLAKGGATAE